MLETDGYETAKVLFSMEATRDIPIVAMTAGSSRMTGTDASWPA